MRPAYVTRCPDCMVRVEIPDEMQETKIKDKETGKTSIIRWFDPDRMLQKLHSCRV